MSAAPLDEAEADRLLDVKAVAAWLGLPTSWVYTAAESGHIPSFKLGKYRRFRQADVHRWLEARRQDGSR